MKFRKKMLAILLALLTISMIAPITVMAPPSTIQVWWYEDAVRIGGDGTLIYEAFNDRIPPEDPRGYIEFRVTGKAYHADMEWLYNYYPLQDFEASPFVIANGKFAVWARYTSPASGLPILDKLRGNLVIDENQGTAFGSYVQYSYAFGTAEAVLAAYEHAKESPRAQGMWLIGITDYTVHGQQET